MKTTVNSQGFYRAFQDMRPNNFTDEGLDALYQYLADYEQDTGEELELDVIALCCDYSEITMQDAKQYDCCADCATLDECMNAMQEETTVIPVNDESFIIQEF